MGNVSLFGIEVPVAAIIVVVALVVVVLLGSVVKGYLDEMKKK